VSVLGDALFSPTELNRRPGEILRAAEEQPVTIARPQALVIIRRDLARDLLAEGALLRRLATVMVALISREPPLQRQKPVGYPRFLRSTWLPWPQNSGQRLRTLTRPTTGGTWPMSSTSGANRRLP